MQLVSLPPGEIETFGPRSGAIAAAGSMAILSSTADAKLYAGVPPHLNSAPLRCGCFAPAARAGQNENVADDIVLDGLTV